jgi:hypothetical protein
MKLIHDELPPAAESAPACADRIAVVLSQQRLEASAGRWRFRRGMT